MRLTPQERKQAMKQLTQTEQQAEHTLHILEKVCKEGESCVQRERDN